MNRASSADSPPAQLTVRGLRHAFGGVQAVAGVDLTLPGGEVCALLGENGAGKSTLMKAVAGVFRPDAGDIRVEGQPLPPGDPRAARERGVSLIYQELNLVLGLPVYENIALGRERGRWRLDRDAERAEAARLLGELEAGIEPDRIVESLSVAERQLVEIAKALSIDCRVLVMDEPTSALSGLEVERLFRVIRRLAAAGVAIVYITHRLEEVAAVADRVVVMRDGAIVLDGPRSAHDADRLVEAMVGRPLDRQFPETVRQPGDVLLEARELKAPPRVLGVDLDVRKGEIVALTGLVGSGRTEVGRLLFGADAALSGTLTLDGEAFRFAHPEAAIRAGVGWVSEDRQGEGLVLSMSVLANLTLPHLRHFQRMGVVDRAAERRLARRRTEELSIRSASVDQPIAELSGGNQQKVALARWLTEDCRLLICDEPTRGVDVGGRYEIYELLEALARRGVAILMISSDMPEVLGMADRIVVLHDGRVAGRLEAGDATPERLLALAMGRAS